MRYYSFYLIAALLLMYTSAFTQDTAESTLLADARLPEKKYIHPLAPEKSAAPADPGKIDVMRHHKPLSASYNGYAIELAVSKLPLHRDNPLFHKFGNIYYDILSDGQYSYCILVSFTSKEAVSLYQQNVVKAQAPASRVIYYKKGNRSNHLK
jgi:hypothetical protein